MEKKSLKYFPILLITAFTLYFWSNSAQPAYAMHITEGFLPLKWAIMWWVLFIPFLIAGIYRIRKIINETPEAKMMLGISAAFVFVLSALKLPSVSGSTSHPTGMGLGTVLFGPIVMSVLGFIVLLFQSLLLAHGGLTTLGANGFAMAVVGPFMAYWVILLTRKIGFSNRVSIFSGALIGNLSTYVVTSLQLALAFPAAVGGVMASFQKFIGIFMITQIPLAISEALLTVIVINLLLKYNSEELRLLKMPMKEGTKL